MSQQYIINEKGERVVPGTRRPDGTMRKEKVVKAGYTPQDEQVAYTSRNVLAQRNAPIIPGVDNEEVLSLQKAAVTKKNKKEATDKPVKQKAPPNPAPPAPVSAPAPHPPQEAVEDSEKVRLEKEVRKMKKKIREVDHLVEKQMKGDPLAPAEAEKMSKLSAWQADLERLEKELTAL